MKSTYNSFVPANTVNLPAPLLTIDVALPADESQPLDLSALPTKPGVFVLEVEDGGTLALATTANLRRMVASRLEPIAADDGPTRRIDYRKLAHRARATTVGGAFEADWAYLQLARTRVPTACKAALDRWQAWFVRCDPEATFPQWLKTAHPGVERGVHLGPLPDKHTAGRYIDMLEDAFDLCRYHHLLVQAPKATACAYKEMGKCPAPCDGSISMDQYRMQVEEAIAFGSTPLDEFRARLESKLSDGDEETARRAKALLDRTEFATKPALAHLARLDDFRFIAVMPGERDGWARLFVILGGNIVPLVDVPADLDRQALNDLHDLLMAHTGLPAMFASDAARENLALVCWHLFRPPKAKQRGSFVALNEGFSPQQLQKALRSFAKPDAQAGASVAEQFTEDAGRS